MLAEESAGRDEADRILLCVDAVHGCGADAATPVDLGCDFFVAGCHKWVFGPRGTGLVWARATSRFGEPKPGTLVPGPICR